MGHFDALFSSFHIGDLHLRNRTVMASMGTNYSNEDGTVSDQAIAYYAERARGGVGLIITESSPASPKAKHRARCICAYDDSFLPGLRRLVTAVHDHGTAIALQLIHAGRHADPKLTGNPIQAPSPIPRWPGAPVPTELTVEEIDEIVTYFGAQARRAQAAGFDAVEVLGGHGYLIHLFLSPRTNKRNDQYGGSSENRLRFALEVLRQVRKDVGESFPVIFRFSAEEFADGGYPLEEGRDWAKEFERVGASALHVSGGTNETVRSSAQVIQPMVFPDGNLVYLAEAVKNTVAIPIIAVGRLNTPEMADRVLTDGKADLVAAGRAFLADPHWPAKANRGEPDRIRQCVACNHCLWTLYQQQPISCFQNPELGREAQQRVDPKGEPSKVLIVGGGPAGLEASRVASMRGHHVTLLEKNSRLGGQLILASVPPYKKNLLKTIDWLTREIQRQGVTVKLNTCATPSMIETEKPDEVIVATGASPIIPNHPPATGHNALTAWQVLGGHEVGTRVLVLGGGMVGVETAEFLSEKGYQVTLVEMLGELATDMEGTTRTIMLERLSQSTISVRVSTRVEEIREDRVRVTTDGRTEWLEAETIVLALGARANKELLQKLTGRIPRLHSVGDCVEPRKAKEAIHEGFLAGLRVGSDGDDGS